MPFPHDRPAPVRPAPIHPSFRRSEDHGLSKANFCFATIRTTTAPLPPGGAYQSPDIISTTKLPTRKPSFPVRMRAT